MGLVSELRRRNVLRMAVLYALAAWLIMQVAEVTIGLANLPEWIGPAILGLLAVGFPIALIFSWFYELTPEGINLEKDVAAAESITRVTGRRMDLIVIALMAAGLLMFAYDKWWTGPPPEKSIAVLPFVNLSSDKEQEYFSDGITEEILNVLASVKQLKVAGRTSSFAFKGQSRDLRQIGEALGVNHILEGSVRRSGTTVRITAQLIQAKDGFHLWSEAYDRELTNVFAIQDEISSAILEQLKLQLLDTETSAMVATPTDTRAYEQYLLAKQRIYDRNLRSLEVALELLNSAIAIDPNYAPAHAQRAIVVLLLSEDQYGETPREEAHSLAKGYIDEALLLDPSLAEAWAALGLYFLSLPSTHNEAIEALERASSINPNLIDASNWLQIAYGYAGQTGKVLPMLEDLLERDPLYRPVIGNAIREYNRLGMQERSLAIIERARPYIPDDAHLVAYKARTFLTMGRFSEALPLVEEAVRRQPTDAMFRLILGQALFSTHQYERMLNSELNDFWLSFVLDILGRREEATILANKLAEQGFPGPLFGMMTRSGRFSEMVTYVDQRWADLDSYEEAFPHGDFGHGMMLSLAFAYLKTGHDEEFSDAMARVRKAHDQLIVEGIQVLDFFWGEAGYYTLAGDDDKAIEQLEIAIEKGAVSTLRISDSSPEFKPLEGDPRYEAIQADMIDHINTERAELGLELVTPAM